VKFTFTEEQVLVRDSAREFLTAHAGSAQLRQAMSLPRGYDPKVWRSVTLDLGWTGVALPESVGGSGLGMVELGIVLEEMGRCLYGGPYLASTGFASALLLESPVTTYRDNLLTKIARGECICAVAFTDDTGLAGARAVNVKLDADGITLSGHASFVLSGNVADYFIVVVLDTRNEKSELILAVVDAAASGLFIEPLIAMDLTRPYARLQFKSVIPAAFLTQASAGEVERGIQIAQIALAAEQLGSMQGIMDITTEYTRQRVQFGRSIGSFQAIKHRLADMLVICEAARSAAYYAICVVDEYRSGTASEQELAEAAALVKAYCSSSFHEVAGHAIQLHGGIGFTWEHDAHLYFKRARATSNLLGSPQYHHERIAVLIGLNML